MQALGTAALACLRCFPAASLHALTLAQPRLVQHPHTHDLSAGTSISWTQRHDVSLPVCNECSHDNARVRHGANDSRCVLASWCCCQPDLIATGKQFARAMLSECSRRGACRPHDAAWSRFPTKRPVTSRRWLHEPDAGVVMRLPAVMLAVHCLSEDVWPQTSCTQTKPSKISSVCHCCFQTQKYGRHGGGMTSNTKAE
jgi:hypothetical protein